MTILPLRGTLSEKVKLYFVNDLVTDLILGVNVLYHYGIVIDL
jgi:hypothetical protein